MVYCYILRLSNQTHYCGMTKDLVKRLKEHQEGKSKSTKRFLPVHLIWCVRCENGNVARSWEVKIKNEGVSRWLHKNIGIGRAPIYPPQEDSATVIHDDIKK